MNLFKKTAAAVLAVIFLLSGCAGGNTTWAFKYEDMQMPTGLYIIYEINAIAGLRTKISEENNNSETISASKPSELLKMTVEGQPATDWVNAETQKNAQEYFAVKKKFESAGLQISDSELASIDSSAKSVKSQNSELYDKLGVSEASIKEFYAGILRKSKLFVSLYGEGGELAVPENELKGYLSEHFVMAYAMPFYKPYAVPEGETKTLDELEAEMKTSAEGYFKRLQAGEAIEQLAYDWQLENASEADKGTVEKPSKEDLCIIIADEDRESFGDALVDAAFKAGIGTPEMIEDSNFYVIFDRADILSDAAVFDGYKNTALQGLKGEEFNEKLREWGTAVAMEPNNATIDKYKPNKLKLDDAQTQAQA